MSLFDLFKSKTELARESGLVTARVAEAARLALQERGEKLFAAVKEAAEKNPKVTDRWQLKVACLPQNGGAYSVTLTLVEPHWRGCMMQFSIRPDRLHSLYGPYGPEENFPIDFLDTMIERAVEKVISFH